MQWNYTQGEATLRAAVAALQHTPGTPTRRRQQLFDGIAVTLGLAVMLVQLWPWRLPLLLICLLLAIPAWVLLFWALHRSFPARAVWRLKNAGKLAGMPCPASLTLRGGLLLERVDLNGLPPEENTYRPGDLQLLAAVDGGVLLLFAGGNFTFLPPQSFNARCNIPDTLQLLNDWNQPAQAAQG